jgi:ATP-binding cassette, subfamily C, bacterial
MKKVRARLAASWADSTLRAFTATLLRTMSWQVALAIVLLLLRSVTQSAQLLLLVPLMQLVGLDVEGGSIGWLDEIVSSAFALVGLQPTLATVLGAFVIFTAGLALITRWQTIYNFKLEQDFAATLRQRLYRTIASTNWLTFSRSRASDFTHALTTELDRVGTATGFFLRIVTDVALVSVYIVLALQLSVEMTLLVFAAGAVLLLLLRKKTRAAKWTGADISLATNGLYSAAIEHLSGMKTVKSYGAEERNTQLFSKLADRVARMYLNGTRNYAETAFWFTVGSAIILSAILYVSLEVLDLQASGVLLLLFLFNRMIPLFNNVQQGYQEFLNALPAFNGVMEIQARCEAAAEPDRSYSKKVEIGDGIRFEEVSLAYSEGTPAVRDLDLTIPARKTTALVGPSGAGKSTVADLVMGLIAPARGRIMVDGVPLTAELVRPWRDRIGYVAQDTFLFNDTIRNNLLWACPGASAGEIREALKLAAAEEFISRLPEGLETVLGDRGVRLSGGERQRLALARALLRKPDLLILDEATSALDSENERRVQSAIEELYGRMTILVITHRLSTIRNADGIHVLEEGRLVESGTWASLFGREAGRFEALCSAQRISSASGA